jgi:hypothetical protein
VRDRVEGHRADPAQLGEEVARRLLAAGGGHILEQAERQAV